MEIYSDAHTFGLKSANQTAVSNSNLAISWLEATFPEFNNEAMDGENLLALKARPYALFDASLCLQVYLFTLYFYIAYVCHYTHASNCEVICAKPVLMVWVVDICVCVKHGSFRYISDRHVSKNKCFS